MSDKNSELARFKKSFKEDFKDELRIIDRVLKRLIFLEQRVRHCEVVLESVRRWSVAMDQPSSKSGIDGDEERNSPIRFQGDY